MERLSPAVYCRLRDVAASFRSDFEFTMTDRGVELVIMGRRLVASSPIELLERLIEVKKFTKEKAREIVKAICAEYCCQSADLVFGKQIELYETLLVQNRERESK